MKKLIQAFDYANLLVSLAFSFIEKTFPLKGERSSLLKGKGFPS